VTATLPPAAAPAAEVIPARAWRVLAVTSLGVFLVLLDTTSINLAFPAITAAFPSSTRAALWWVLNAYAIGAASRRGGRSCCLSMRTSRGRFDPGRCRDCARESDLLDHYWQVQRQKRALIQAQRSAWHAHATPSGRCRVPSSRCSGRHRPAHGLIHRGRRCAMEPGVHYEIRWSAWFDGLQVSCDDRGQTTVTGPVADQAALHGLPAKVRDLGLELLQVRRTDPTTAMEVTRCSMDRSHGARQQRRGVGSAGSPGGSSGVSRPRPRRYPCRPQGGAPGTGAASRSHGTDPVVPLAATLPRACARTRDQKERACCWRTGTP
jgi:hypothetical protein